MTEHGATRLAFVGAGALGQAFAGLLAANGQPVTLLATPRSATRLLEAGYVRLYGAVELEIPIVAAPAPAGQISVTTDPAQLPADVGLIFATKAHQLPAAIGAVRAVWPPPDDRVSWVGGLQNGIVKDDFLADAFGRERTLGMVTILAGQSDADGRINVTSRGMTYIGELAGGHSERVIETAALLQQSGIPATASDDIQSVVWSKTCHAAGIFGVSVLARASGPRLMRSPDLVRAYLSLMRESATIAEALGIALGDYSGFPIQTYLAQPDAETLKTFAAQAAQQQSVPAGDEQLPSMTRDLLSHRALEVDEVFGDLVVRAERIGLPAARLKLVRDLIRGIDPGRKTSETQG